MRRWTRMILGIAALWHGSGPWLGLSTLARKHFSLLNALRLTFGIPTHIFSKVEDIHIPPTSRAKCEAVQIGQVALN